MSWDCPHWNNEICTLNGIACIPGKGQCVLRNRYEIISPQNRKKKKEKENNNNRNSENPG